MPAFTELPPLSIYIHIPWCIKKCPYCDFNSHPMGGDLPQRRYVQALIHDLETVIPLVWSRRIRSIFIGGGTPSLFKPEHIDHLLTTVRAYFPLQPDLETTLEMNPGSLTQENLLGFRQAGINRLSIGAQSFQDPLLKGLGRIHDAKQIEATYALARASGFENINLDLMYGLPGQTSEQTMEDVERVVHLQPEHISYYQLTIEPNTYFHKHPPSIPQSEQIWDMEQQAYSHLHQYQYYQYEVSAFSKSGRECLHNQNYWLFGDYIGVGAGAHGKITQEHAVYRQARPKHPKEYMQLCEQGFVNWEKRKLETEDLGFEFLLNALRLKQGFDKNLFTNRTGIDAEFLKEKLKIPTEQGLIEYNNIVKASEKGYRHLNSILECCLPSSPTRTSRNQKII